MKKLIELLNEYEKELNTGLHWRIDEKYGMLWRGLNLMGVDQYLISKHYGFIERLVDNDKIDKDKLYNSEYKPYFWNRTTNAFGGFWAENILLMLLSISPSPIEDLILYLK